VEEEGAMMKHKLTLSALPPLLTQNQNKKLPGSDQDLHDNYRLTPPLPLWITPFFLGDTKIYYLFNQQASRLRGIKGGHL